MGCDNVRNQTYRAPANRQSCGMPGPGFMADSLPVLALLPTQQLGAVFEPEYGFCKGTLFPELYKPWGKVGCQE